MYGKCVGESKANGECVGMMGGERHDDFGSSTGGDHHSWEETPGDKETWWWNDKVQEVIKAKKEAMNGRQDDI